MTTIQDLSFLYVEDDPLSREVMQMIMENAMGVQHLTIFEDSSHFMARLYALDPRPDLLLLDIHMQPHDGFTLLEMIRADATFSAAKVVALTASVMNEEVAKLRQSGFDGAIGKPLSVATFPDLVSRILDGETVWHIV